MKSLDKMPCVLIEETCENFCNSLWNLEEENSREMADAITQFQENLRNFIIRELLDSSIVEEKENA